ncbi:MAG: hypothetical protein PHQ10_01230 [Dehalococcoidales bacterium]|nr:hypothetical protein [Dehalococcoidales bacterium]MDD3265163.1 hypothetical protein [Dehalococcoidales bacterium]MDD4322336.1 hypothetical protein [Dehalococcoidales bacterium]MDD4794816.1 hypothetical protein [Dehalococcoidales bacterium]MDD5122236.1 hypothetical protein [Dehalococcoidales bacterium]
MASRWRTSYQKLENYLKATPAIKIEPQSVFIPQDVKDTFYSHFDDVRNDFLGEHFAGEISLGNEISTRFKDLEAEVTGMLNIKNEVRIAAPLRWFIKDPVNGMNRPLLALLFDLLKGKLDEDTFEESAINQIKELFEKQFSAAYEKMVILSLIKWLQPTQALTMPLDDLNLYSSSQEGDSQYERINMPPDLYDMKEMIFDYAGRVSYLAPEVIVYSPVVKKYVGIKTGFIGVAWHARFVSEDREWIDQAPFHKVFTHLNPWPNIMIYLDDSAENIKMVADKTRVCRPEWIIDTVAMRDFFNEKSISRIKAHNEMLKPFLGTAVVSREEAPAEAYEVLMPEPTLQTDNQEDTAGGKGGNQNVISEDASAAETPVQIELQEEESEKSLIQITTTGYDYDLLAEVFSSLLNKETSPAE